TAWDDRKRRAERPDRRRSRHEDDPWDRLPPVKDPGIIITPMSSVVVHYGELALKGRNRPWFINTLIRSIRSALRGLDIGEVKPLIGRIGITLGPAADWSEIRERLSALPGIGNFSFAHEVPPDIDALADGVVAGVAGRTTESFRVLARRAD